MTEKPIMTNKYADWWANTGSAIRPYVDDDFYSHAKRVSERAWRACENQSETKLTSIDELLGELIGEGENEFADRLSWAMKGTSEQLKLQGKMHDMVEGYEQRPVKDCAIL